MDVDGGIVQIYFNTHWILIEGTKELYDRFNNNTITVQQLLEELSFFVPND